MIIAGARGFAKELLQVYYRDFSKENIYFFDNINICDDDKIYGQFDLINTNENLKLLLKKDNEFALGIGTPKNRKTLYDLFIEIGGKPISIISKKANIGYFGTTIGDACSIVDGVIITNDVKIGKGTLLNLNCTVGHDSVIGCFCDISPNVNISGNCTIRNYCSIGTGAVIIPGITIGEHVTIGAGSVITKDIAKNSVVVGVPGKIIKKKDDFKK